MDECSDTKLDCLAKSISKVLGDADVKNLAVYKWNYITRKSQFQSLPMVITESLKEEDFLKLDNEAQVLLLRKAVRDKWPSLQLESEQIELLRWIAKKWGRISRIKDETLKTYATHISDVQSGSSEAQKARAALHKMERISSKSKCMAFVDPENWFIYDSRVAMALDVIIRALHEDYKWEFILPKGRSKAARSFSYEKQPVADYSDYCRLIKLVGKKMKQESDGRELQCIEMSLFMLGGQLETFDSLLQSKFVKK